MDDSSEDHNMTRQFGTVRQLESGRFQALYSSSLASGRQVARTFDDRRTATAWLNAERQRIQSGSWTDPRAGRVRFGDYFESWIGGKVVARRTELLYRQLWRTHLRDTFEPLALERIQPTHVRAWHGAATRSVDYHQVAVAKAYRLLANVLGDAVRDGSILRNPCTIKGAGSERSPEVRHLTPDEVFRLAEAIHPHHRLLVLVAAFSGCRWGELAGLRVECVDAHAGALRIDRALLETPEGLVFGPPKTRAGVRTVHLPRPITDELTSHIRTLTSPTALVFTTVEGRPLRRGNFAKRWNPARLAIGLPALRFHDLRHTAATWATVHGATIREVQARLGHATPAAALRYQHASAERDRLLAGKLATMQMEADPASVNYT